MPILMDETGVQALKTLAQQLPEATELIEEAATLLQTSFDEKKAVLGHNSAAIGEIIETIDSAQKTGKGSMVKIQNGLLRAAAALAAILGHTITAGGNP